MIETFHAERTNRGVFKQKFGTQQFTVLSEMTRNYNN